MKKIYETPEIQITEFSSASITNAIMLSGVQTSFKPNSAKNIKSGNEIIF